jgi:hypothetical protein
MVITTLNKQTEVLLDNEARRIGFIGEHHSPESITASISETELTPRIDLEFQGNTVAIYEFPLSHADNAGLDPEIMETRESHDDGCIENAEASKRPIRPIRLSTLPSGKRELLTIRLPLSTRRTSTGSLQA